MNRYANGSAKQGEATVTVPARCRGVVMNIEVKGVAVGPFVVFSQRQLAKHGGKSSWTNPGYSVTHAKTGFSACPNIPTAGAAVKAAKALESLPVDWSFTDPATVKQWSENVLGLVAAIRSKAQGTSRSQP